MALRALGDRRVIGQKLMNLEVFSSLKDSVILESLGF